MFIKYPILHDLQLVNEKQEAHYSGHFTEMVVLLSKYPSSGTQRFVILFSTLKCIDALQEVQ